MPGVLGHTCNPRAREVQAGGLGVQGHLQLHRKFEDSRAIWGTL